MAKLGLLPFRWFFSRLISACKKQPVVCAKTANRFGEWLLSLLRR